jgi:hypothetical protein
MNKIPNNQEEIASQLNRMFGLDTVADDGNVFVRNVVKEEVLNRIKQEFGSVRVGDGVQEGDILINGGEL